ncbi:MAG: MFS transporter [Clostridia bacterium]|nr:MFS transporter [Clostridia bacterium]
MRRNYKFTVYACYIAYLTQALVINYTPLLYVTFQQELGLTLSQISLLIAINFGTQMLTDLCSSPIVEKIGHRTAVVLAHIFCSSGMIGLAILPSIMDHAFLAIIIPTVICGVGGGLIEVMVSPIMEACPTKHKSAQMSLLHSFYCWGQAGVVLISTLLFSLFGLQYWPLIACFWALIPMCDIILFLFVPINDLVSEGEGETRRQLLSRPIFWALMGLMFCAGASEITMSQWASGFAETGLGVPKAMGDLLGPCLFALLMGSARLLTAKLSRCMPLNRLLTVSCLLCILSYLIAVFAPHPIVALMGCGLCGLSVGAMWPGTFSLAAAHLPRGGFPMFAILAFCGDVGCTVGPTLSGQIAAICDGNLKAAYLFAILFPICALGILMTLCQKKKNEVTPS